MGSNDLIRVAPESGRSDFIEMRLAGLAVPVRVEYSAIRDLRAGFDGDGERIGLLLGSSSPQALSIQHCELLALSPATLGDPKALQVALHQFIRARSRTPLEHAPHLLGHFRTHVTGWTGMTDLDLQIANRCFPGLDPLFLVIRTTRHRPWLAALYALDAKATKVPSEPPREFLFDEYLLKGYLTDLVETPEQEDVQEKLKNTKTRWIIAALLFAILLAGSAAAYKYHLAGRSELAEGNLSGLEPLNLKVVRNGKDFEVSWDRSSAAVQRASNGMLTINDGALTRTVTLSGPQLREGQILYTPLFEELTFRLEVGTPGQGAAAESVQVLAWSGRQPADVVTVGKNAAPADPLKNILPQAVASAPPPVASAAVKSAPAAAPNNLKQPQSAKEPPPVKPAASPESVAVVQPPSPSVVRSQDVAPAAPARAPETSPPAVASVRPSTATQPTPQPPANTQPAQSPVSAPPSQPPAAPAPKPEAPAKQSSPAVPAAPSQTPPTVAPATGRGAMPAPVLATSTSPNTIVPAVPIQRVAPTLPRGVPAGTTAGVARVISVRVMVDSAGSVQSSEVIASKPQGAFGEAQIKTAALDAAKQWKFRPCQVNGKNVSAEYTIDFEFR